MSTSDIPDGFTSRFTDDAAPPFDAPQGCLAWIELPTGNVYLQANFKWIDPEYTTRSNILNNCLRFLGPGPEWGSLLAYHVMFARAFYKHQYPVYSRIPKDAGDFRTTERVY